MKVPKKTSDKKSFIVIAAWLFFGLIFLLANNTIIVSAETPRIIMQNGVITIIKESHAATTNIRYRTIGYMVTTKSKGKTETVTIGGKTYYGYAPLSDYGEFSLSASEITPGGTVGDTTTTYFKFSDEKVKESLIGKLNLDELKEDTTIYFSCIFQTYQIVDGKEVILNPKITDWKTAMRDQGWGPSTLAEFADYYYIPCPFKAGPQENSLYYDYDGKKEFQKELKTKFIDETVSWPDVDTQITASNKKYDLVGYYVEPKYSKATVSGTKSKYLSSGASLSEIINGSAIVPYGGLNVHMVYEPTNVSVKIRAVDENGTLIKDSNFDGTLYTGTATPGKSFSKVVNNVITLTNGTSYKKTVDFNLQFERKDGSNGLLYRTTEKADDPIAFTVPDTILRGSTLIVEVYYEKTNTKLIPVTVKAVNKDTNATISTLTTGSVSGGGSYSYSIEDSIPVGTKTFQYSGEWKWQYTQNSATAPTVSKTGSGAIVSFTAPTADKITGGITVIVYYKEKIAASDKVKLRTIMVGSSGALIKELSEEDVTLNQAISKTITSPKSVNGVTYIYANKWTYDYMTSSGSTSNTGSGTKAVFNIPSSTKLGTTVTLKIYYNGSQVVEIPEVAEPIGVSLDEPEDPYAVINGDKYDDPYFTSKKGISTTESQHVYVKTKDYLLGYNLVNRTGKVTYYVPVRKHYILKYFSATPDEFGGKKEVTKEIINTQHVKIERAYSYWEITNLEYYNVSSSNVYNYSLPDGTVALNANQVYMNVPSLSTSHSTTLTDHVIAPSQVTQGIDIYGETISSDSDTMPTVEYDDLTAYAYSIGEAQVKNDSLIFNGSTILSSSSASKIAPTPNVSPLKQCSTVTQDKALFTEGKIIDAEKENGTYSSTGNVTYSRHPNSINAYRSTLNYKLSVNSVIIHTPVICNPVITADNSKWTQLIHPADGAVQIVLDPDTSLNDFTMKISNTLLHSNRLGYLERDFSRSFIDPTNVSYIAKKDGIVRNEVKFPFDVFVDTHNDKDANNDEFIKAGTWTILGRNTYRFYVPMWVKEGSYSVLFRSIAVNGTDKIAKTETTRNASLSNYVATATRLFEVSGRIYGLTLYDISDYPNWENVFRKKQSTRLKYFECATDGTKRTDFNTAYSYYYTVGTRDQYGNDTGRYSRYTLPLVNGSHPKLKNLGIIKTGYAVRFLLDTTGEMYSSASQVKITPTFYYVDAEGKNRRQVDLYYKEEIKGKDYSFIKVGEGIDLVNIKTGTTGNPYNRIPEAELKNTAAVQKTTLIKIENQNSTMYSYSQIRLLKAFRTFIGKGYGAQIKGMSAYEDVKNETGETSLSLSKYTQRWYGNYKLPIEVYAAPSGYDVKGYLRRNGLDYTEDFWLTGGYIIVNFNIVTIDDNGKERLSYINGSNYLNNGNCSMWVTEGAMVQKTSYKGPVFNFKAGDFIINYTDKRYTDDYEGMLY